MYHKNRLNFRHRPAVCAGNFALVASAAADRNRSAQFFSKRLLAVPYSAVLQKMTISENIVRVSAHVYTQVCFVNLELNRMRCFSVRFKLGQSGSASVPLSLVPPFFIPLHFFSVYTFLMRLPRSFRIRINRYF